jgi:hypothetical protein
MNRQEFITIAISAALLSILRSNITVNIKRRALRKFYSSFPAQPSPREQEVAAFLVR